MTFGSYLTSRIVAIQVAQDTVYHLHSSLLCRESHRFDKDLTLGFKEANDLVINLDDENPKEFCSFVEFLYKPDWQPLCQDGSDAVQLARLYAMGERFLAQGFQDTILRPFRAYMNKHPDSIKDDHVCTLLDIACSELVERPPPNDNPIRNHIFWLAALRLSDLQKDEVFQTLLYDHLELGRQLCLRAGNASMRMARQAVRAQE
jgi:hypothetical protein